jgi:hypothetical protein
MAVHQLSQLRKRFVRAEIGVDNHSAFSTTAELDWTRMRLIKA